MGNLDKVNFIKSKEMKHLHIKILVLLLTISFFSCSNEDEKESIVTPKSIEGIWNATNYSGNINRKYTTYYDYYDGTFKIEENTPSEDNEPWDNNLIFGRNVWTFNADKSLITQNSDIKDMKYEKHLVDTKNNLLLLYKTTNTSIPDSYTIEEFTSKKLVVSINKEIKGIWNIEDIYEKNPQRPLESILIGYKKINYDGTKYDKIIFERVE